MKYLLNYSDQGFQESQKRNTQTGLTVGKFDNVFECRREDIDPEFYEENKHILSCSKGAGYWLWKPYMLNKMLNLIEENDYLFYSDSGSYFIESVDPIINISNNEGVVLFHINEGTNYNCDQVKRDAFILMGCDNVEYWYNQSPINAAFCLFKKNAFSLKFVSEWLYWARDERILIDTPNICGEPNLPEFVAHRHDQSILSILAKKYNIISFTDPSQYGNPYRTNSKIPHIINHTRS